MSNESFRPDKSESPAAPKKGADQQGQEACCEDQEQCGREQMAGRQQMCCEPDGTERARDEARQGGGPRYGGGAWSVADERGDRRYGHARNDDADPSELAKGAANNDDDESPSAADPELAAAEQNAEIESGGQRAGFGRGEAPRKPKSREKPSCC
ncbi:MAG TPA: hypothetical protein VNO30_32025 [Kofleriaceae bacterium]|nr:hypothetical protein [Kofleriaceae bacterium]